MDYNRSSIEHELQINNGPFPIKYEITDPFPKFNGIILHDRFSFTKGFCIHDLGRRSGRSASLSIPVAPFTNMD